MNDGSDADGGRERQVVQAFLDLSGDLVDGYDVLETLAHLTDSCARLLDIASAGLLLADPNGVLHLAAASSERTHHLEVYQLQRDQGPCLDCYRDVAPVLVPDLREAGARWPHFARAAELAGYRSVHALPMRLRGQALGTLGLFGERPGVLTEDDVALAQALAHVASVAIVNERSAADREAVNSQLQRALTSRIVVEQAKGVVAHGGGLEMDDAFRALRAYARDHGRRLSEVAADIVGRQLATAVLLGHARAAGILPED